MVNTLNSKISDSTKDVPKQESSSLISNEKLRELYAAMVKCRMLEQRATELFQHGKLSSDFHRSAGCEASAVAVAVDLTPVDVLCVAPGAWLPAFVKGMSAESLVRALALGDESTGAAPTKTEAERSNVLVNRDQAQQHKLVLSRAAEARATKNGAVVVVFISSAYSSLDGWSEVMTSAAAKTLPIVFVHLSEETESSNRRARNPEALFHGVPAISVDAADPVAIYRVAFEAILRARQDRGATLLECITVAPWSVDPVNAMENYLRRKGIEPHEGQIVESFQRELDRATLFLQR